MAQAHCNTKKKPREFSHLSSFQRGEIQALHNEGKSQQEIADIIGCNKSTICRELKRGTVTQRRSDLTEYKAYFAEAGQAIYEKNRSNCGAKYKLFDVPKFIHFAIEKIQKEDWSIDAVCGYAKTNNLFDGKIVCTNTLYSYVDLGLLPIKNIDLPLKVTRSPKKKRNRKNKKILGQSIEKRPKHIEDRKEFGHWEIDTVLGNRKQGAALLTLTERKTRNEHIFKIDQKTTNAVDQALQGLKNIYGSLFSKVFKSITSDNGSEFSELENSIDSKHVEVYYAHPYSSFERGTNERANGLIRRFIPKGKPINDIDEKHIDYVEKWHNSLPRKILGYKTPNDLFQKEIQSLLGGITA